MMPKQLVSVDGVVYVPKGEKVEWPPKSPALHPGGHKFMAAIFVHGNEPWLYNEGGCGKMPRPRWQWQAVIDYIKALAKKHGYVEGCTEIEAALVGERDRALLRIRELEDGSYHALQVAEQRIKELEREVERQKHQLYMRLGGEPAKLTLWVREIGRADGQHYDKSLAWCDKEGEFIKHGPVGEYVLACNASGAEARLARHGIHVNVKVWGEAKRALHHQECDCRSCRATKKQQPLTESEVSKILSDARAAVKAGTMTGIDASMLKWDTLIKHTESGGGIHKEWQGACGLCIEYSITPYFVGKRDCSKCPLVDCTTSDWKQMAASMGDMGSGYIWLGAAHRFRTWIKDTYDAWLAKQKPQDEWVYGVWESACNLSGFHYTKSGIICGGSAMSVEQAISNLLKATSIHIHTKESTDKWVKGHMSSTTPIFGVRKLREGEGASLRMASDDYVCAFYKGKRIMGAWEHIESHATIIEAANEVVKYVLNKLKLSTPAVTLADLPTA